MAALQALAIVLYPFAVYFALGRASPRSIGLFTLGLLLLRLALVSRQRLAATARVFAPVAVVFGSASLAAALWGDARALLLAPAVFNAAMFGVFAVSLGRPQSAIERLARAQVGELPADEVAYCRRVTAVWCAFFVLNGAVCAALALWASREAWAAYTGALAYAFLGALFAGEYVYRHWRFRRYRGGPADGLLRRLFPPREGSLGH
ncbi:MAG TPA: septation protein IspZ [Myxococcota bacterium]|nr:septation protein IspZ [Myxococcota bacterium]